MGQKVFDKALAPSASVSDMFMIDPREIQIREEYNGRHEEPEVDDLIEDFMNPNIGQIVPVTVTKDDGAPVLLAGHRRYRAAIAVTKAKNGPFDGVFKLKCTYYRGKPLECFMLTVRENLNRKEVSPTCDGWNISKFRNFGMSDEDIAIKVYGRKSLDGKPDTKWIEDRAAMIDLTPEAMEAVASGIVKPSAVVALAKMKKQAQRDLIRDNAGKITTAVIKRVTSPVAQSDAAQSVPIAPAKRKQANTANCCEILDRYIGMELPKHILAMTPQAAVREVLRQVSDEIECGQ